MNISKNQPIVIALLFSTIVLILAWITSYFYYDMKREQAYENALEQARQIMNEQKLHYEGGQHGKDELEKMLNKDGV